MTGPLAANVVVEVSPLRIDAFDQLELPSSFPFFDLLLSLDRRRHGVLEFEVNQPVNAVFFGEAPDETLFVLPHALSGIACDAGVQGAVTPAR